MRASAASYLALLQTQYIQEHSTPLLKMLNEVVDPRIIKGLSLDPPMPDNDMSDDCPISDIHTFFKDLETNCDIFNVPLLEGLQKPVSVTKRCISIDGGDNNVIDLFVHEPARKSPDEILPCVMYLHGGGMCVFTADSPVYAQFGADLADSLHAVVVCVNFRNASGSLGPHPFPAGLNDCLAAVEWLHSNKTLLGFNKFILCGESGGANLSSAVVLSLNRDAKIHVVDGVYLMCPFVSGLYGSEETDASRELPSLRKYTGCGVVDLKSLHFMSRAYDPCNEHSRNPLAWPYWASPADLAGLPPHAVSLNEADPLYDEGAAYYRKLIKAGVRARGRTVLGTPHAGDLLGMKFVPELYRTTINDIKDLIESV
jgi:acetyl esterase